MENQETNSEQIIECSSKASLIAKIKRGPIDKDLLIKYILGLPGKNPPRSPNIIKKGDVFMHPVFKHPYVILWKKDNHYICVLLTTNSNLKEIYEECNSRFFDGSNFAMSVFALEEPVGMFLNVYDNNKQLSRIANNIKKTFG